MIPKHSVSDGPTTSAGLARWFGVASTALALSVVLRATAPAPTASADPGPVFNPVTGHYYEAVATGNIGWTASRNAAAARSYAGCPGHLATLTSAQEMAFIGTNFPAALSGNYYLGGYQLPGSEEPAGGWTWITGEPWDYANWAPNEPNNNGPGPESFLQLCAGGWNDTLDIAWYYGYVVEYECPNPVNVTSYDLARDFSIESNPNGPWSYGWAVSSSAQFEFCTESAHYVDQYGECKGWWLPPSPWIMSPGYAVTDILGRTWFHPKGTLSLHPGHSGHNCFVRWTAPARGIYRIDGWFTGNDFRYPTTTDVVILHNSEQLFAGFVESYRRALYFGLTVSAQLGDTIDFRVGYGRNNNYYGDSTGIEATISLLASPPSADAGPDQTVECSGNGSASVTLDGSGSSDPDGDPLTYTWAGPFPEGGGTVQGMTPTVTLPLGQSTITLVVSDGQFEAQDELTITVEDTTPPQIIVVDTPPVLWPPNHKYVQVAIDQLVKEVLDSCDSGLTLEAVRITRVTSDEPEDAPGGGDGHTTQDIVIAEDCHTVQLRAERLGSGNGRVYTIHLAVLDSAGNLATIAVPVLVPHAAGGSAVDDGAQYTVEREGCTAPPPEET